MFRGSPSVVIDDKGRLAIPKGYRQLLSERWGEPVRLTLTIGLTPDIERHRWLDAFPAAEWDAYEEKLNELPPFEWESRKVAGMLIGHANDVELDRQGRIVVPPTLREFAGPSAPGRRLSDRVVVDSRCGTRRGGRSGEPNRSPRLERSSPIRHLHSGPSSDDPYTGAGGSGARWARVRSRSGCRRLYVRSRRAHQSDSRSNGRERPRGGNRPGSPMRYARGFVLPIRASRWFMRASTRCVTSVASGGLPATSTACSSISGSRPRSSRMRRGDSRSATRALSICGWTPAMESRSPRGWRESRSGSLPA